MGTYVWISDDTQSKYSVWKNTCKGFLAQNYQDDISFSDYEKAIEKF